MARGDDMNEGPGPQDEMSGSRRGEEKVFGKDLRRAKGQSFTLEVRCVSGLTHVSMVGGIRRRVDG